MIMSESALLKSKLDDPWWRLTSGNLYKIMIKTPDENGSLVIPFIPNDYQFEFLQSMHTRNTILKARQLGFTTLIAILFIDSVLFRSNVRAAMVAQTEADAKKIFRDKVLFAYNNLPDDLRSAMPTGRESASELLFNHNNSSISVATSTRGGTLQYLHISEFGKICAEFKKRADEIVTGSIPSLADDGLLIVESTSEGAEGYFHDICKLAEKNKQAGKKLTTKEYEFHFFPWWKAVEYSCDPSGVVVTDKDNEYFDRIEGEEGIILTPGQRAWWVSTRDNEFAGQEEMMWQEYPSTSKEAFQNSSEGCFFSVQLAAARKEGRISHIPHNPGTPVNTYWDIGSSDGTGIWLHQRVGQKDNFIKYIEGYNEPYSYYVSKLQSLDYVWGTHYLPHDANHVRQGMNTNSSPYAMLKELGLTNMEIVPVVDKRIHGIQMLRDAFHACWFDEVHCKEGVEHLELYKKRFNMTTGLFTDEPVKAHTEAADALRQFAQSNKGERTKAKKINFKGWN